MATSGKTPQHRARLGLTGLAAVFLLVLAAAAIIQPGPQNSASISPEEPLAMLGLAPAASRQSPETSR